MSLIRSLLRPTPFQANYPYTLEDYSGWLHDAWPNGLVQQTWATNEEVIEGDFQGLVTRAFQANGVVFACELTRFMVFSQARFQWQQLRNGRPGDLFGTADLRILEEPEPGRVTADLLTSAMLDADLSGDWFGVRRPDRIKRLRPDWTVVVIGSPNRGYEVPAYDPDAEVIGYIYSPGGIYSPTEDPIVFDRNEVAHFFPVPDPLARYRGMPLLTAVIRNVRGHSAATSHKLQFFEHAATPNLVVKFPPGLPKAKADEWISLFEQEHSGVWNAYRTAYLGAGADITVAGRDMQQMAFKEVQGTDETIIAAAMGVHPTVVGLSEGLQGASLNAGNFQQGIRLTAGKTWYPNWNNLAGSLQSIVPPLPGTRLWPDTRDIAILAENAKDRADVTYTQTQSVSLLVQAGYDPEAAVLAVKSDDLGMLEGTHSGLYSVQLQPPGSQQPDQVAALTTFWPTSTGAAPVTVQRGDLLPADHALVRAYPSLFGRAEEIGAAA